MPKTKPTASATPPASPPADNRPAAPGDNGATQPTPDGQAQPNAPIYYDGSTPHPDPRQEEMAQMVVAGWVPWRAYKAAYKVDIKQNSCYERVSVIRKGTDYSKREGWLTANKPKPHEVALNVAKSDTPKHQVAPKMVDLPRSKQELTPDLIRNVLIRAIDSGTMDSVTMQAVNHAIKLLRLDAPSDARPDPGAIAAWFASGAGGREELDAICRSLSQLYKVHVGISVKDNTTCLPNTLQANA